MLATPRLRQKGVKLCGTKTNVWLSSSQNCELTDWRFTGALNPVMPGAKMCGQLLSSTINNFRISFLPFVTEKGHRRLSIDSQG